VGRKENRVRVVSKEYEYDQQGRVGITTQESFFKFETPPPTRKIPLLIYRFWTQPSKRKQLAEEREKMRSYMAKVQTPEEVLNAIFEGNPPSNGNRHLNEIFSGPARRPSARNRKSLIA